MDEFMRYWPTWSDNKLIRNAPPWICRCGLSVEEDVSTASVLHSQPMFSREGIVGRALPSRVLFRRCAQLVRRETVGLRRTYVLFGILFFVFC